MKQGKHYTTVILWIFIAAIAAYFGYNVVSSLTEPLTTASVIEYEAGAGCYTTGFLVRDEEILPMTLPSSPAPRARMYPQTRRSPPAI